MLLACVALGCDASESTSVSDSSAATSASLDTTAATTSASSTQPAATDEELDRWKRCAERIAGVKAQPSLPGASRHEQQRVHLARARGRAMLWRREPTPADPKLLAARKKNDNYKDLVQAVRRLINKTKKRTRRRELVLREGYLWSDDVELALALVEQVSLTKLYSNPTLYLQRGVDVHELKFAKRTKLERDRYLYVGGPLDGERAEILLGDRVADTREQLQQTPSLGVDLRDLMNRGTFDRMRPVHFTDTALVTELRYGPDVWVTALVDIDGPKAELACEHLDPELAVQKTAFETSMATLRGAMKRVRKVVRAMVRDRVPFDADRNQSNGFLRKAWKRAYFKGWKKFNYEGKLREVYTADGHPKPPQVCIDFLTDTWERASGTWYEPATGDPLKPAPKRTEGGIDFDKLKVGNRRSVAKFTKFTEEQTDWFDVWAIPKNKRIPFKKREPFFDYLHQQADMFRPGDMLTIHGYKEGGRPHYHSIMILEQDPITGIPTLVAGNAVFAREQTLDGVMHISPQRSLRHRIRVKDKWLAPIRSLAESGAPI